MQIQAKRRGLRVMEIPVSYARRGGGASKISGTWRGSVNAGFKILKVIGGAVFSSPYLTSDNR